MATLARRVSEDEQLLRAVLADDLARLELVLGEGANPDWPGVAGTSPLHVACYHGSSKCAAALLRQGANARATYSYGETPLHLSAREGRVRCTSVLLEHEADVYAKDRWGNTPLHLTARYNHPTSMRTLLQKSAYNIDVTDADGDTPLHDAAMRGHAPCVRILLGAGANPLVENKAGKTPLDVAKAPSVRHLLRNALAAIEQHAAASSRSTNRGRGVVCAPRSPRSPRLPHSARETDRTPPSSSSSHRRSHRRSRHHAHHPSASASSPGTAHTSEASPSSQGSLTSASPSSRRHRHQRHHRHHYSTEQHRSRRAHPEDAPQAHAHKRAQHHAQHAQQPQASTSSSGAVAEAATSSHSAQSLPSPRTPSQGMEVVRRLRKQHSRRRPHGDRHEPDEPPHHATGSISTSNSGPTNSNSGPIVGSGSGGSAAVGHHYELGIGPVPPMLVTFLERDNLVHYAPLLHREEIDHETLLLCRDSDLRKIGLPLGARLKILRRAQEILLARKEIRGELLFQSYQEGEVEVTWQYTWQGQLVKTVDRKVHSQAEMKQFMKHVREFK
jgi:Ankyrin repeats (3 copies)/Ankyrin repeat/SAM domain (Sterile alpha motif)